jgi:cytoskeleton protein RodZ
MTGGLGSFTDEPGQMLRSARIEKGLDVTKLAADLRVSATVLEAMEINRFESFDAPVYAKGFLRKYAAMLGLDPVVVIAAYDARSGGPAEPTHVPVTPAAPRIRIHLPWRRRLPSGRSLVLVGAVLAALALAYWYTGYRSASLRAVSAATVVVPSPHDETRAVPAEATSRPAVAPVLPASIPVSEPDTADTGVPLSVTRTATLPEAREDEITIRGVKDAWVEVRGPDGSRLFYDHVRAGEMRAVRAAGPWRIYLSDADAVEVSLGAHIVDVPASKRTGTEARFGLRANGSIL